MVHAFDPSELEHEPCQGTLTVSEAERLVQSLQSIAISEIGGETWMLHQEAVMALNLQAHQNAAAHADEFVKELLILHDCLPLLVLDLLTVEAWKAKALPLLRTHLTANYDSVAAYQLLYHEGNLASLLEVILYHEDAREALGDDAAQELADWCGRRLLWLMSANCREHALLQKDCRRLLDASAEEQLRQQEAEIDFACAISSITILRYLTDKTSSVPLGLPARLMAPTDVPVLLSAILDNPPWERRTEKGSFQRYEGGNWQPSDRLRLSQVAVQAWLILCNLLLDPGTWARYDLDSSRTAALLRLRHLMTPTAQDQLPLLRSLLRLVEAVAVGQNTHVKESDKARLIMEQVPQMRQALLRTVSDWPALADHQKQTVFSQAAQQSGVAERRRDQMLAAIDLLCAEDGNLSTMAAKQQKAWDAQTETLQSTVRVVAEAEVSPGIFTAWETYELPIDTAAVSEPVQVAVADQPPIIGDRRRLQPIREDAASRVMPTLGRITVSHGGRTVQSRVQLPASETRDTTKLPPSIWLTAGRLKVEGMALQLQLRKLPQAAERDKAVGTWHAYHIIGGALSVTANKAAGTTETSDRDNALNF